MGPSILRKIYWCLHFPPEFKSFFCQTPVPSPDFSLGLGVDFVLPLSQEEEQEQQEPHQNMPEGNIRGLNFGNKPH